MQGQSLSAVQGDPINTEGLKMPDTIRTAGIAFKCGRNIKAGVRLFARQERHTRPVRNAQLSRMLWERPLSLKRECRRQSSLMKEFIDFDVSRRRQRHFDITFDALAEDFFCLLLSRGRSKGSMDSFSRR